jgi:PhoPQ-activated pathogenicity-related protein
MKKTLRFQVTVLGNSHDYVVSKNGDIYVDSLPFSMHLSYNKEKKRHEVISTFYRESDKLLIHGSLPFCLAFIKGSVLTSLLTMELTFSNE